MRDLHQEKMFTCIQLRMKIRKFAIKFSFFVIFSLFHLVERVLLKSTVQYKFVRNQNIHHIINRKTLAISLKIEQVHIRGL